ncbi:MAG: hypothetical protein O3B47_04825 [bacterium]|nr:hypothetical protein [bacterium]
MIKVGEVFNDENLFLEENFMDFVWRTVGAGGVHADDFDLEFTEFVGKSFCYFAIIRIVFGAVKLVLEAGEVVVSVQSCAVFRVAAVCSKWRCWWRGFSSPVMKLQ